MKNKAKRDPLQAGSERGALTEAPELNDNKTR
jgi:hypothetical protein